MATKIKGFTLIELLLVLVLMGAVFGLTMPYFFGISKMETVSSAADNFAEKIKEVQSDALSNEQRYALPGRKALGQFIALPGRNATSFDLGIFLDNGTWQVTKSFPLTTNLVVDAPLSTGGTVYFKSVSGQTRFANTFHAGLEPSPMTGSVSFYFHFLGETSPSSWIQVEPSGRISVFNGSMPSPTPTIFGATPTPSPLPTSIPTNVPTVTPTALPSSTPTPTVGLTPTSIPVPTPATVFNGLVAYWKMDETSGTRYDSVNHEDLADYGSVGSNTGKVGNAASFSGNWDSQWFAHTSDSNLSVNGTDFTMTFWVYPTVLDNLQRLVVKGNASTYGYAIDLNDNNRIRFCTGNGSIGCIEATAVLSQNTWYFVAVKYTSSSSQIAVSVNNGAFNTATSSLGDWGTCFSIGALAPSCTGSSWNFGGRIDEVGLWKRVLSAPEITDLYNGGAGLTYGFTPTPILPTPTIIPTAFPTPIPTALPTNTPTPIPTVTPTPSGCNPLVTDSHTAALWHFDETSGVNVSDASSYGNNGTASGTSVNNGTSIVAGKFGKARSFNGFDDLVTVGSNNIFNLNDNFTIEAWAQSPMMSSHYNADIIVRVNWWTLAIGGIIGDGFSGLLRLFDTQGNGAYTTSSYANNTWHHIAAVKNGGVSTIKIYVDGVLQGVRTDTSWTSWRQGLGNTASPVLIGGNLNGSFRGVIDEIRISNVARSNLEIQQDACQ